MSKFNIKLNYKDCCILKHALKEKIEVREAVVASHEEDKIYVAETEKMKKELEEEKRALERLTEQIENEKENNHMKGRWLYGKGTI